MFGDRIVFRAIQEEKVGMQKTEGGILIPQAVTESAQQQRRNYKGTALYIGDECKHVKVGSIVAYDQYGIATFNHEGEELMIVREKDLIGMYE